MTYNWGTLDKLSNCFVPQFPHVSYEDNNDTHPKSSCENELGCSLLGIPWAEAEQGEKLLKYARLSCYWGSNRGSGDTEQASEVFLWWKREHLCANPICAWVLVDGWLRVISSAISTLSLSANRADFFHFNNNNNSAAEDWRGAELEPWEQAPTPSITRQSRGTGVNTCSACHKDVPEQSDTWAWELPSAQPGGSSSCRRCEWYATECK